jgi:hypothetical protein
VYTNIDLRDFDPNDAESWVEAEQVLWNAWADLCFEDGGKKPGIPDELYHGLEDVWKFCRAQAERIDPDAPRRWAEKQTQAITKRMNAETN